MEWNGMELNWIGKAFRYSMNSNRQETGTRRSWSHTSNITPEQLAERVWWTKSQYSLLNITSVPVDCSHRPYLLTSATVRIPVHITPICGKEPIWYMTLHFQDRRSFTPSRKSHRNHRSYVWTGAPSGIVFVPAVPKPKYPLWSWTQMIMKK